MPIEEWLSPPLIPAHAGIQDLLCAGSPLTRGRADKFHPQHSPSVHRKSRILGLTGTNFLTCVITPQICPPSRSPRVLSRGIAKAERDAASRAFAHASKLPGGSGNPPSAITSGRHKRVHARLRRAMELADGEAFLLHPARDRANNRRGGAPRGEHPRWDARRVATSAFTRVFVALWRLRTCVTGPPTGAAAPERLSALRSPRRL
jgi:hypothetical protein